MRCEIGIIASQNRHFRVVKRPVWEKSPDHSMHCPDSLSVLHSLLERLVGVVGRHEGGRYELLARACFLPYSLLNMTKTFALSVLFVNHNL